MKNDELKEILKDIGTEKVPEDILEIAEQTSRNFEKTLTSF